MTLTACSPKSEDDGLAVRLAGVRAMVNHAATAAGRDPAGVRVLLATKTVGADRVLAVLRAGWTLIGENRVQEVLAKAPELEEARLAGVPHELHFIGHLQSNKVNQVLPRLTCLQTLDSAELADRLDRRLAALDRTLDVMVQVNVSGEASKSGVDPEAALDLVGAVAARSRLRVTGLMTIGLNSPDRGAVRAGYARLAQLREQVLAQRLAGPGPIELSMGMSGDYADAITEGATMVRLGSAVFGARPAR
ncbi:YggS family pyridoxal phosphate-dependent enzyme [Nakamurella leprariae]|uniref:Pyridoxal phosphate homeostasis protein n=1 Tax=Nakamurella leprariae TaxID=2803911 RepID=A0A938YGG5_9ACTN|nr:YggS family pyridoxal phosphate-dependent enzyme [Nakamurella leprariae]MBM9467684.1 YggS family pyridoxal phosphate-dependent enzyme [Nakamurella leprariae]